MSARFLIHKHLFPLNPEIAYFNHGALGVAPHEIWKEVHRLEKRIESNPAQFFDRELSSEYQEACDVLGAFIGADGKHVVLIENATYAVNLVLRSLQFEPGDEVLISDHEYGAYSRLWSLLEKKFGVKVVKQHVALPIQSSEEVFEAFCSGVTSKTKFIFFSHIASRTALRFPAKKICSTAREQGILTMVDGAHVPGQLKLSLQEIGADFYTGNCHKWLFAPRPCGFLYAHPGVQELLEPLIVSWGEHAPGACSSPFKDDNFWLGTQDYTRVLAIPKAIEFFESHRFWSIAQECQEYVKDVGSFLSDQLNFPLLYPMDSNLAAQMVALQIPACDPHQVRERLAKEYKIEVSTGFWNELTVMRIAMQCYNSPDDVDRLCRALAEIF